MHGKCPPGHGYSIYVYVSQEIVYMPMSMVNVPHDRLKACVNIVNVPQGMILQVFIDTVNVFQNIVKVYMNMLQVSHDMLKAYVDIVMLNRAW
jgi:hypothetical protein